MSQTIEMIDPVTGEIIDEQQIAEQLLAQAKEQGVSLVGPGGLLGGLTKTVLETALDAEMTEHLGYEKHASSNGENAQRDPVQDRVHRGRCRRDRRAERS